MPIDNVWALIFQFLVNFYSVDFYENFYDETFMYWATKSLFLLSFSTHFLDFPAQPNIFFEILSSNKTGPTSSPALFNTIAIKLLLV